MKTARYVFSEIPNDPYGEWLITQMKSYLNKDRYKFRVRGQHLKDGLNWREHTYGQSIENSKNLRVYVEGTEDVISLTPKQIKGLVYHLNEELYRQYVHGDNQDRIISEKLLNGCVNFYNSPNIPDSIEEQEQEYE
jgi:hypothetical protein